MNFAFKTIAEFNDYFRDEKTCYEFFEQVRWNGVPVCPHCGSLKAPYKVKARGKFTDIPSYRCSERACDLPFTVRTKSIFEGSKVEFRKWLQAAFELSICKNGISSVELGNRIGVSQKTAWFINHRLRDMLTETEPALLQDVIQIDETPVGGKNKNRHADKKVKGGQGRSPKGKTVVFGARSLDGKVRAKVVPNVLAETLIPVIEGWIEKGSIMVSDDWAAYKQLKQNYFHVVVNHSDGEYVRGGFTTNGIENFWSLLKRGITGTYHCVSAKHLEKYTAEFAARYNNKEKTNIDRFFQLIGSSDTERVTYKKLTGK